MDVWGIFLVLLDSCWIVSTTVTRIPAENKSAEKEQIDYLIRFFMSVEFPSGTRLCDSVENCNGQVQRCDWTTRLCTAKDTPEFPLQLKNVNCSSDQACPFFYKCHNDKCEYSLFRACSSKQECCQGCGGLDYECLERNAHMPGKQCYRKCSKDRDCWDCSTGNNGLDSCRYPDIFQKLITCCAGYCSKRIVC